MRVIMTEETESFRESWWGGEGGGGGGLGDNKREGGFRRKMKGEIRLPSCWMDKVCWRNVGRKSEAAAEGGEEEEEEEEARGALMTTRRNPWQWPDGLLKI